MELYLATSNGLMRCQRDDEWRMIDHALIGHEITCVMARPDLILAGTPSGLFRSDDHGHTWQAANEGLSIQHLRWMAFHPDQPERAFVGTESAAIFVSHDHAASWRECEEVAQLRNRFHWFLPYSREAGCIRGFAWHGARGYAAAEVGGALRSDDSGESWRLTDGSDGKPRFDDPSPPLIHPDVHSIEVHSSSADFVYAPTGGGFYRSIDGGQTWARVYECYCRAVWIDPLDPDHIVLGPADGVSTNGRIEESRDGGRTWRLASNGLPVPWPRHMVERFTPVGDELLAVLSNGELIATSAYKLEWRRILPDIGGINAVSA